jgi:activator of HSP90 ATPase
VEIEFSVSDVIPANPQEIYDAWLSSAGHADLTGGQAAQASTEVGDCFTAWAGYINGKNVVLEPGRRIVQSWRTTAFAGSDADSQIELLLEQVAGGTKVTLRHSNVPDGHTTYREGWQTHYFEPMKAHFKGQKKAGGGR